MWYLAQKGFQWTNTLAYFVPASHRRRRNKFFTTPTLERRREAKTGRPVGRSDEDPTDRRPTPHDDGRDRPRPVQERGAEAGGRPGLELIKPFFSLLSSLTGEEAK